MYDFLKTNQDLFFISLVIGLVLAIVQLLHNFTDNINKRKTILFAVLAVVIYISILLTFWDNEILFWVFISVSILLACFVLYHLLYIRKHVIRGNIKPISNFKRFEEIKELKYGFIEYSPFFWQERHHHKGIGIEVLNRVFENKVKLECCQYNYGENGSNWNTVFEDLCEHTFDIIITPLFETRSRLYSYNISYCSPLFYSNIGIYVNNNLLSDEDRKKLPLPFKKAISFIEEKIKKSKWIPEILKGEISESLVNKYHLNSQMPKSQMVQLKPANDSDFITVLKNISSGHKDKGDFTFMEVFKAQSIINSNKVETDVFNILRDNELLYPVSFVVRKEDTVLRNLINIRLMELRDNGELKEIIKQVANAVDINDTMFEGIFIQKYNYEKID